MKAASFLTRYLADLGVRHVFGVPGSQAIDLINAVEEAGIDFVLTHHEATAAFCAAMTGQLTGVPGVCIGGGGPGAVNLGAGIATAHLDRMPMIAIVAEHAADPTAPLHQRLKPSFFPSISSFSSVLKADQLGEHLPTLVEAAMGPPPGPVVLGISGADLACEVGSVESINPVTKPSEPASPEPNLDDAISRIARAKRPMVVIGVGVTSHATNEELISLVEKLQSPVADTSESKGWIPNTHPLYVGTISTHRNAAIKDLVARSDLLVTVGLDSVELLSAWELDTPQLHLTENRSPDPGLPGPRVIVGSLQQAARVLAGAASPGGAWPAGTVAECRSQIIDGLRPSDSAAAGSMWPQTVVAELQRAAPDVTVAVDNGSHKLLMVQQWVAERPNSFLNSGGMSTMGTGLPFAIAAKLQDPEQQVCTVVGDGGFLMYAGELATLARIGLPIVVLIMNDASLSSIRVKQTRRNLEPIGTQYPMISIAQIARGYGLHGVRVTSDGECRTALEAAFIADRATVIEAVVDPRGYELSQ